MIFPAKASVVPACPTAEKKACHSELVEESALEVTAPASAYEFPTRWSEP
jgi:hypothetical protein